MDNFLKLSTYPRKNENYKPMFKQKEKPKVDFFERQLFTYQQQQQLQQF